MGEAAMFNKGIKIPITILLFAFFSLLLAEKVGKFQLKTVPETFHDSTFKLPEEIVGMSEYVRVKDPQTIENLSHLASIVFVIDNSSSNFQNMAPMSDRWGARFTVTSALIDSLKEINPLTEVGVVVYDGGLGFRPGSDPLFTDKYIPLLELGKDYNSAIGTRSGYDILKHYLDTTTRQYIPGWNYKGLRYNLATVNGTNITTAFDAAKGAMSKSTRPKKNQFIIYFSDGESTMGGNGYVQGTNVPTTFAIFLTANGGGGVYPKLTEMINNIKVNNYSTSNPDSYIKSIKSDHNVLMSELLHIIVDKIILKINTYTPEKLQVNGENPISPWDKNGFLFKDIFPLTTNNNNDFNYIIDYKVRTDSISGKDTTFLGEKDVTHNVQIKTEIDPAATVHDSLEYTYWGRKLELFHKGTKISKIMEDMTDLEIRFTEYKEDTLYGYEKIKIYVRNDDNSNQDEELFSLKQNGLEHSYTFKRKLTNATKNNGTFEHSEKDYFIALFKNPKLPRDTIELRIPYDFIEKHRVTSATYFDNNADGFVDSMFIEVSGDFAKKYGQKILDEIKLPSFRQLDIVKKTFFDNGIALTVEEKSNAIQTFCTDDDRLKLTKEVSLSNDSELLPFDIKIKDAIAPVIMKASLKDAFTINIKSGKKDTVVQKVKPTLTVHLSEPIREKDVKKTPFKYYRRNGKITFDADLSIQKIDDEKATFTVESVKKVDYIEKDSIWINWTVGSNIRDAQKNNQDNKGNIKRLISRKTTIDTAYIPEPFDFMVKASIMERNAYKPLDKQIRSIPEVKQVLAQTTKNGSGEYKGVSVITVDPTPMENITPFDEFRATLDLYDALGNKILSNVPMGLYRSSKTHRLLYVWNGENITLRTVGGASYLAVVTIEHYFNHKERVLVRSITQKITLGVK